VTFAELDRLLAPIVDSLERIAAALEVGVRLPAPAERPPSPGQFSRATEDHELKRALTALLLCHPEILGAVRPAFARLLLGPPLLVLRAAMFDYQALGAQPWSASGLRGHLIDHGLGLQADWVMHGGVPAACQPEAEPAEVIAAWTRIHTRLMGGA
jgi:DNA primase